MMRLSPLCGLLPAMLLVPAAEACQCQSSYAPCHEAAVSNVVFIGTVEAISPVFLSRWNAAGPGSMRSLNDAWIDAQDHPSAATLSSLKEAYFRAFPDPDPAARQRVEAAKNNLDVASAFYSTLGGGMKIRFKVATLFKHEEDDDDDVPNKPRDVKSGLKAGDEKDGYIEISTAFGDCGVDFQAGETYLVYADNDEDTGLLSTTSCTRTRRLTDAGEDLAYLFFYKERPEESTRLEGFATADHQYQLDLNKMRDPATVKSAVPGVVVELSSAALTRYARADAKGRFVFDGLGAGEYTLSAFDRDFPAKQIPLAAPLRVSLEPKSCVLRFLVVSEGAPK